MRKDYGDWLRSNGYPEQTVSAQLYRVQRVEDAFGELENHFHEDGLSSILETLAYSSEDERNARPNPSQIQINGNLRANLASYKDAVKRYQTFLDRGSIKKRESASSGKREEALDFERAITLQEFGYDGRAVLTAIIASSKYRTIAQAVASLTLFSHPETVQQTECKALFPTIRGPRDVGKIVEIGGRLVFLDDNRSPTDAFLWSNGISNRGRDNQFNHIWAVSQDPDAYTALPNICMTPACIAKLTDTDREVCALLTYRSYDLYGWVPKDEPIPAKPDGYDELKWAEPLPPTDNLRERLKRAMATKEKSRTVLAAKKLGWLFEPKAGQFPT